uniref:Uncharacterized protein n=1 Tax=Meloidogyne enterolobii TaxID=390850 RepID=A0A6V7V859_MELEN|nr:unnamed protein product [Meloidogyne enterolobii]
MTTDYENWIGEMEKLALARENNSKAIQESQPLDVEKLSALDDNVTVFLNKLKNISATTIEELLLNLEELNLTNHLDEIALIICTTKVEEAQFAAFINFVVKISSFYRQFGDCLLSEFKKQMPDTDLLYHEDPLACFEADLRFFSELALVGIFGDKGLKLICHVLALFVKTDEQEHLKSSILLPFCKAHFYPITGILPYSMQQYTKILPASKEVTSDTEQIDIIIQILGDYRKSLVEHTNKKYEEMIKLEMSLEMSLKTGGASSKQRFEQTNNKQHFERLLEYENELSEVLGQAPMQFPQGNVSVDERGVGANVNLSNEEVKTNNNSIKRESASNVLTSSTQTENPRSNLPLENLQMESNTPPNRRAGRSFSDYWDQCRRSISTYYRRSKRSVSQVCTSSVFWSAATFIFSYVVACFVIFWIVSSVMDNLETTFNRRFDRFEENVKKIFNLQFRGINLTMEKLEFNLSKKITNFGGRMNRKFTKMEGRMNRKFTKMDTKITDLDTKLGNLTERMNKMDTNIVNLNYVFWHLTNVNITLWRHIDDVNSSLSSKIDAWYQQKHLDIIQDHN